MRLPKFWKDSGSGNEMLVTLSILFNVVGWIVIARHFHSDALGLASPLLGMVTGFIMGFGLVVILCTYFRKD